MGSQRVGHDWSGAHFKKKKTHCYVTIFKILWELHFQTLKFFLHNHLYFMLCCAMFSCSVVSDFLFCIWLFATPWTVACQTPLFLGILPGKNTGVDCRALLQRIFPTQGSNPGLLHCRQILYHQRYFMLHVLKYYSEKGFIELPKGILVQNMLRTLL